MGVIFDLDGTLINSIGTHTKAMKIAMDKVLGKDVVSTTFVRAHIRYPSSILFKQLRVELKKKLAAETVKKIMEIRDAELTPRLIKKIKFFNGVFQTVGLLKELGISYCIATSMNSRELSKFIPNLKLNSVSEIIINSPRLDLEKPNPFILNKSIKTCKMSKSHTYYVGDSPYDLVASRRAGVHFIGVFNKKELGKHPGFCKDILSLKDRLERNPDALRDKF